MLMTEQSSYPQEPSEDVAVQVVHYKKNDAELPDSLKEMLERHARELSAEAELIHFVDGDEEAILTVKCPRADAWSYPVAGNIAEEQVVEP
jgi:hypothetical protein